MKTNLLFCLFPFRGHTIQALRIIENLNKTGKYNILVDLGQEYDDYLPPGVEKHHCLYGFRSKKYQNNYSKDTLINYGEGILSTLEGYRKWYSKGEFSPDLICFDSLAFWGKALADENNIPSIALHTIQPFDAEAFNKDGYKFLQPYTKVFSSEIEFRRIIHIYSKIVIGKYHLQSDFSFADVLSAKGDYNLVLVPDYLCKYKNALNGNNMIYNPIVRDCLSGMEKSNIKSIAKEKIIYISTGSIINRKSFLIKCIDQCLNASDFEIYVSAGDFAKELKKRYKNQRQIHIYCFAPQVTVLRKASLFITHGGMNSICESIYYETPMIVIPFINDEYLNAKMVEESGIGLMLNEKTFEKNLSESIKTILNDRSMHANISYASKKMKSIDTISYAQDIFNNLVGKTV